MEKLSINDLSLFLSRYIAWLLGSGATSIRLEKNVSRIANAYGKEVELFIMPRHIHLSIWERGKTDVTTSIAAVNHTAISFNLNTELSNLSWEIADKKLDFKEAQDQFEHYIHSDSQNKWLVLILVAFANAAFCRLFGGDWQAMLVVGIATLAGYYLKILMLEKGSDLRLMAIICSFVSSVLGASCQLFEFGTTPDIAIGTRCSILCRAFPSSIPSVICFTGIIYVR